MRFRSSQGSHDLQALHQDSKMSKGSSFPSMLPTLPLDLRVSYVAAGRTFILATLEVGTLERYMEYQAVGEVAACLPYCQNSPTRLLLLRLFVSRPGHVSLELEAVGGFGFPLAYRACIPGTNNLLYYSKRLPRPV